MVSAASTEKFAQVVAKRCGLARTTEDTPITHITNGVHLPTWIAPISDRLRKNRAKTGRGKRATAAMEAGIEDISDEDLWQGSRQ